jgi:hypothetical protein
MFFPYNNKQVFSTKKANKLQRDSFLIQNNYLKDLAVFDKVHGSGSILTFLPGSGTAKN